MKKGLFIVALLLFRCNPRGEKTQQQFSSGLELSFFVHAVELAILSCNKLNDVTKKTTRISFHWSVFQVPRNVSLLLRSIDEPRLSNRSRLLKSPVSE